MSLELEIFKEYPHKIELPVAWVDMDIYKHVNNTNYFKYFEAGRIKYLEIVSFFGDYKEKGIAGVLSRASCNFIAPLIYPDIITIGTQIVEIKKDSIQMEQYISCPRSGLAAFGESEIVIFDFKNAKKINVPVSLKLEIEKFENKKF
jgi:acyl-CoA thioester hydrolase